MKALIFFALPALLLAGAAGAFLVRSPDKAGDAGPASAGGETGGETGGAEVPCAEPGLRYAHTLAKGESLSAVAARAGLAPGQIAGLNGLTDPDRLLPGAQLLLRAEAPGAPGRAGCRLAPPPGADEVRIEVYKAERCLELRVRGVLLRRYRVGLGREPLGHKRAEGDGRTPEGEFHVCQRLPEGRYGPSLGLSYPGVTDAERGLRQGVITVAQHRAIRESCAAGRRPPWDTPLGGAICIHGRGSAEDWTAGCIALDDADAGEVFALAPMGTSVKVAARRHPAGR